MTTPRAFVDSTISTDFPSAIVGGAIGGYPMGRWQHLSRFRGMPQVEHETNKTTFAPLGTACAKKDLRAPPMRYINRWSGTEKGFAHLGAPNLPHHSRTGNLTIIESPRNSHQGAGYILSKISAANNNKYLCTSEITILVSEEIR